MIRRLVPWIAVLVFCLPTVSAQESQSLGDIARKLRAQKNGSQTASTPSVSVPPAVGNTVATQHSSVPVPAVTVPQEAPIVPDLNANVATDVQGLSKYEAAIWALFQQEKFQEIDRLASEVRASKARFPGGYWKVHIIYLALAQPSSGLNASEDVWNQHLARLERWKQQFPSSITARIALAESYNNYGWKARGGGYADQVADDGWRLLAERARKGREILEDAKTLPEKCPEWFAAMITIARTEEWDADKLGALFQQAIAFEPDYYYYYRMMADSLLPKWGGEEGDSAQFAEAVANHIGGKKGDLTYYEIATTIICACDNEHGLNGMSWPRIKSGYQALTELYGTSISHLNEMAMMAFRAGEFDYSSSLFDQIGGNWDKNVWLSHDSFANFKFQATIPRMKRSLAAAKENGRTPEGQLFMSALTADLEKRYHQKLMDCMKQVPDFALPSISLLLEVTKNGVIHDVMFAPDTTPSACFRPQLEQAVLPTPPKPDYWVIVQMTVKDPVTVGVK